MIYLNGRYCMEVKDKRCSIHPNGNIILKERDPPISLTTQYQVKKTFR